MSDLEIEFFVERALLASKDRDSADWQPLMEEIMATGQGAGVLRCGDIPPARVRWGDLILLEAESVCCGLTTATTFRLANVRLMTLGYRSCPPMQAAWCQAHSRFSGESERQRPAVLIASLAQIRIDGHFSAPGMPDWPRVVPSAWDDQRREKDDEEILSRCSSCRVATRAWRFGRGWRKRRRPVDDSIRLR